MKTITVDITPSGNVKIDVKGMTGASCAKETEQLEIVLGGQGKKNRKKKPEFFAPATTKAGQKLTF